MSAREITIEEIVAYVLDTFSGVVEETNWGERALFYNPDRRLPKGVYLLTFKERDGENDSASAIRPGDFRLNLGISKEAFAERFGEVPARPSAGGVVQTGHDFTQRDRITPHPVYGWMRWISVVNPTRGTFDEIKPLLEGAYELATEKYRRRLRRTGH